MTEALEKRYSYNGVPTCRAFANSDAFMRGLLGPFGSGKSSACVVEIVRRGMAQRPGPDGVRRTRWLVVRNTFGQLIDTTIRTMHQWLPPIHFGRYWTSPHPRYLITGFENTEIEILFRALDRPDHVRNLLSLDLTGAWVNEAREIPWSVIEALQGRVGRFPTQLDGGPTWHGVFMDTNPPDADSKWHDYFEDKRPKNAAIFKQPSGLAANAENLSNLPGGRNYYANLAEGKDQEWIKVYIKGEYGFIVDGRPVYPEFSDDFHTAKPDDKGRITLTTDPELPVYRGWDFGLTPATVFCQYLPGGRLVVIDELCAESMGIDRHGDDVIQHSSEFYPGRHFIDIGDPAGSQRAQTDERTCFDILGAKGIDIEPGLQSQTIRKESLRRPLMRVDRGKPRCKMIRRGLMGGYHFRRLRTAGAERYSVEPEKNSYSHPVESLEYVATRLFGEGLTSRPIEDEPNDYGTSDQGRSSVTGY